MIRVEIERVGQLRHLALATGRKAFHVLDAQIAGGECAGLVHRHHLHLGELLHRGPAAKEHAAPRAPRDRREDRRRNRKHQRARRRHHEQRHRVVKRAHISLHREKRAMPQAEPPNEEHHEGQREDGVGVARAEFVREPLRRRLVALRVLNEVDDLLQRALLRRTRDHGLDYAPQIDGAREQRIAHAFLHRRSLAGEVRLVRRRLALRDLGVHGELLARLDPQPHPRGQFRHRHHPLHTRGIEHRGRFRGGVEKRTDLPLRAFHGEMLQRSGERKQEEQPRAFRPFANRRCTRRHRQHEEVHVHFSHPQFLPHLADREPRARQIRRGEKPQRQPRVRVFRPPAREAKDQAGQAGRELHLPLALVIVIVPRRVNLDRPRAHPRQPAAARRVVVGFGSVVRVHARKLCRIAAALCQPAKCVRTICASPWATGVWFLRESQSSIFAP